MNALSCRRWQAVLLVVSLLALAALACGPFSATSTPTPLPPTPIPPTPPPAATGTLTIVNNTASTVCYVYISSSEDEEWGPDQLGANNTVPSGGSFDITDIPAGTYDLKATDCDNVTLAEQYGVTLGDQDYTWALSSETAQLVIVNDSSVDICYLYVSPSNAGDWGPDQLGDQTIPAGSQFTLTGITPGTYDLRFEACSGGELEEYGVNISDVFTYTVTD